VSDETKKEGVDPALVELQKTWTDNFAAAKKFWEKWHKSGDKVVDRFLGEKDNEEQDGDKRLNLFYSNIVTLQSMLYGNMPKIDVDRTFADVDDDVARVASNIAQRILQQDIKYRGADFSSALMGVLEDRLLPGLGYARVKYEFDEEEEEIPAQIDSTTGVELAPATTKTKITNERVCFIYTHWKDILIGPCRTYEEVQWMAFRAYMNRKQLKEKFGDDVGGRIPLDSKGPVSPNKTETIEKQAEVWEIWDKENREVLYFVEGFDSILEKSADPLELTNFFPGPRPLIANTTTKKFIPKPDYALSQDLYNEIDILQTRISILTEACKLVGVYDQSMGAIKQVFQEGRENELIPVENWALLGEKGGLKGVIDWVPLEAVAKTIAILDERLGVKIQQLYEVTGLSDLLRGVSQPYEAAATSKAKLQFASVRVQRLQEEFAKFASDLQSLKLEIIQKHFQKESILTQSNIMFTPDAPLAEQAIALLKAPDLVQWRIVIRPESLAQADYAQLKADRTDFLNGVSTFMQSAAPLIEMDKGSIPLVLNLLKWGLAGFKGSDEIEGLMDQGIKAAIEKLKNPDPPPPDPQMLKLQGEIQLAQQEHQSKMAQEQMRMENDRRESQQQMQMAMLEFQAEMRRDQQKHQLEMQQMQQKFALEMAQLRAELSFQRQAANIKMETQEHAAALQMESRNAEARANRGNGAD
jgi:hypothetical protein